MKNILILTGVGLYISLFQSMLNAYTPGVHETSDVSGKSLIVIAVAMGIAFYFLPSIIAFKKKKRNANAICVLNFLLGWTALGWIVAIVWACSEDAVPIIVAHDSIHLE